MNVNWEFSPKQWKAYETLEADGTLSTLYGGSKGGGKSVFGCYYLFTKTAQLINQFNIKASRYPITVGFMGRKRGVDFNDTTLETWKRFIPAEAYTIRTQEKEIVIQNKVKIAFGGFDSEETVKKFNSAEFAYAFIDQAEEISQDDFALLRGTLRLQIEKTPLKYKILLTANPADCWLKDAFITQPLKGFEYVQALPADNPYLPDGYIDNLIESWEHRPEIIEAYVYGNWDSLAGADLVIKPQWISGAVNRNLRNLLDPIIISCDPARYGDDETVIYALKGGELIDSQFYGQKNTMEVAGYCIRLLHKHGAQFIVIDSTGMGAGVEDRLKELGQKVIGINYASKSEDRDIKHRYRNLRAEMYDTVAKMFYEGKVSIPNEITLRQQLSHIKYKAISSSGAVQIESKDDIKRRMSGKSPDRADALIQGLWAQKFTTQKSRDYSRVDPEVLALIKNRQPSEIYQESLRTLMVGNSPYQRSDYDTEYRD